MENGKINSEEFKKLKVLIDSTQEFSSKPKFNLNEKLPQLEKYVSENNFETFDIDVKTEKDAVKKKGLFGRLGDAISGNENIRKERTVITLKMAKLQLLTELRSRLIVS